MKKNNWILERDVPFGGNKNWNVEALHSSYSIFHKDILKRHIFKVPSRVTRVLNDGWKTDSLFSSEGVALPIRVSEIAYSRTFDMVLEEDRVYYLKLETIGNPFHVILNGEEIAFGTGEQRLYEIPVTHILREEENRLSIEFETEKEGILFRVEILNRPENHIMDYQIFTAVEDQEVILEIHPIYHGLFIPTTCFLISPTGKNIKKIKLVSANSFVLHIPRKDIEIWNDETCTLYSLLFVTEEEIVAEKIAIEHARFINSCYWVDDKSITLRVLNLEEQEFDFHTLFREEVIEQMSMWKKRNFNAIYVDKVEQDIFLKQMCLKFGFYYITKNQEIPIQHRKEMVITPEGNIETMPKVYLPFKAWEIQNTNGMVAMKSKMKFGNLREFYYVRIGVYQNSKRIGQKIKYILDFEPGTVEPFHPDWISQLKGEVVIKIEFYQRYRTELVSKEYYYGAYKVRIQK